MNGGDREFRQVERHVADVILGVALERPFVPEETLRARLNLTSAPWVALDVLAWVRFVFLEVLEVSD